MRKGLTTPLLITISCLTRSLKLKSKLIMEWINIKDVPPPQDGTKIMAVSYEFGRQDIVIVAWLDDTVGGIKGTNFTWCEPNSWQDEQGGYATHYITHWMPLPEPPKS